MASKIDGTAIAKSIREGLKAEIEKTQVTNPRFKPNLVIFQGKLLVQWSIVMKQR
jgi:methylenetetrahydrofolate dehydrogenase (NADP+)/methenyltetrahydrofolate cyclohydrolase/formyltetrahydrofolate synthetase